MLRETCSRQSREGTIITATLTLSQSKPGPTQGPRDPSKSFRLQNFWLKKGLKIF